MSKNWFNPKLIEYNDLVGKSRSRIPKFCFDYLSNGCNDNVNLIKNHSDIQKVELQPRYLRKDFKVDLSTKILGQTYSAPFGVAPIGLQGLIWPGSAEILARAACQENVPFILSTVSTLAIEKAAELTNGKMWFQLYNPSSFDIRMDIFRRLNDVDCKVLVLLCDTPSFGFRPKDIQNGLSMPPKMTVKNFAQMFSHPSWLYHTIKHGKPAFKTIEPYMPAGLNLAKLGNFMNESFNGRMDPEMIAEIRNNWKGKLLLKGIVNADDLEIAISLGIDGVIVSNHGGRQLDIGQSTIASLDSLVAKYSSQIEIMMDSGIRTGPDIVRTLSKGARFTFLGRTFMYSVSALGETGGQHAMGLLKTQLIQLMDQLGCDDLRDIQSFSV